jgi:hypothetical protein
MYYLLRYRSFSGEAMLQRPIEPMHSGLSFDNGAIITNPPERVVFNMAAKESGTLGDYVYTEFRGLLVSARFRQSFETAGIDNIQYIPAEIRDIVKNVIHEGYFVANIIGVVDCIDMKKSKLIMLPAMPDKIEDIEELHLDESRAMGLLMFRLGRRMTLIAVAERAKRQIEETGLVGVGFVPAEGYST